MRRFLHLSALTLFTLIVVEPIRADENDPKAIVDKGIKALGGEQKLARSGTYTVKSKGTVSFNGSDHDIKAQTTVEGFDHYRLEFEGDFDGNTIKGVTVVNGKKGWRHFGDPSELDEEGLANEKRGIYLAVIPVTLVPLKGKDFKLESAGEEKVGDKPAVGIKVTGPDGKDFKLYFDKESGLPVRLVGTVVGMDGADFSQQTTFSAYKDFDGIKKATKVESKRDGEKFLDQEITEFKVLEKAPKEAFDEPK